MTIEELLGPREAELLGKLKILLEAYTKEHLETLGIDFGDFFSEDAIVVLMDPTDVRPSTQAKAVDYVLSASDMIFALLEEEGPNIRRVHKAYMTQVAAFTKKSEPKPSERKKAVPKKVGQKPKRKK